MNLVTHQTKVLIILLVSFLNTSYAQHTFSIVAIDSVTGEIGSAGATCLDIDDLAGEEGALVISDIILGIGAIHAQAYWHPLNQSAARNRMVAGDSPQEILNWLSINDPAPGNHQNRQYSIIDLIGGAGGTPRVAGFTGNSNGSVANHIIGPNYAIQGNILISQEVLDDMETGFLNTSGNLEDKLMAAMQGAKRIGAQSTCSGNQTSSKSAFLRVAKVQDLFSNYGHLTIDLNVSKTNFAQDPIDVLQTTYDYYLNNPGTSCGSTVALFPYSESFEAGLGLWAQNDTDLSHVGNTDFNWIRNSSGTPTSNTGPNNATDGFFYLYTEASDANVGFPTKRAVINSPCFDLSNIPDLLSLRFDYHMFGTNTGNLAVRVNNGSGWNTIWLIRGDKGNQWHEAEINLQAYSGQTIQIRMDATTGLGELSDIGIDNFYINSMVTSIEESDLAIIQVYPNPTTGELKINLKNKQESEIIIYDMFSRTVQVNHLNSKSIIDVSNLNTGLYSYIIRTNKNIISTGKFFKNSP